jgi:dihydroorotase
MLLIKNGHIIDPLSKLNEKLDILIDGENVVKIDKNIDETNVDNVIDASSCIVAPGLIDIHSHFRDPGFTYKEDIFTGANAAARGGYTTVICMANTNPVIDNTKDLNYVLNKAQMAKIEVLQVACITKNMSGTEIVDMKKLKKAGAIGFSDDGKPIMNSKVAVDAMNLARELDVVLSFHEEDPNLISENGINSGKIASMLNIKGSPCEAENVLVARDVALAVSTKAKINIQHISSSLSVELVRWAKKMGANVTAEATPQHFSITEDEILKKGANAKLNPPLRTESDRKAIIEALKDNTIEIIATDHAPHSKAEKQGEISKAPSGMIGLETALSLAISKLVKPGHLSYMDVIEKFTVNPAKLYKLDRGYIKEGHRADIVIFNPEEEYIVEDFSSKSCNSPFIGEKLYGKVKNTIYKGAIVYDDKR